ncbi:SLC38A9 [Blepharisma stoltei]|uniref:Amino acid transporter transmembrane domain-containing protein n=1 Tax=Blepharisma stoltei TaxID=1481888 RepID=A0AAU9J1M0_9CILI|nr:unnamed protein product [Blepharisma stoltei]
MSYKQNSWVTVFSIWNTMIGSTVLTMPWGMDQAGVLAGMLMIIGIGVLSLYTCSLIMKVCTRYKSDDVVEMVSRMWGKKGQVASLYMSCLVMLGASMVYNVLMNSSFYDIIDGISLWTTDNDIGCKTCWSGFSSRYTPFILMGCLMVMVNIKEKQKIVKINSLGIYFVLTITIFLIFVGLRAITLDTFTTDSEHIPDSDKKCHHDWNCLKHNHKVEIDLVKPNFLLLSGILTLSYFIHNCIVIIMKNNAEPEKNGRDLSLGYLAVGVCYFLIGTLGYFGFKGNGFTQDITQNALDMFASTNILAFIMRIVLFTQMFTVYPMIMFLVRSQFFGYYYGTDYPSRKHIFIYSLVVCSATTLIASVYPSVGVIAGIVGAFCGLYFVYIVPVCLYLYYYDDDARVKVQEEHSMQLMDDKDMQATDAISNSDLKEDLGNRRNHKIKWTTKKLLHLSICVFGVAVLLFQFLTV